MISPKGVYTALITPFTQDEQVDEEGMRFLIRRQLDNNIDGIVPLGTTGEAPTLLEREKKRIISIAKEESKGRATLMIGTGGYSTAQTIENTLQAQHMGADIALIIVPYYNKPSQEGIYRHFQTLANAIEIPFMIYNHPGRTGQNIHLDTLKRLIEHPLCIGLKDSSGNMTYVAELIEVTRQRRPDFSIMSGDDILTLPLMALGGCGAVSVVSNLLPKEMKQLTDTINEGNFVKAREIHYRLMPMFSASSIEINPVPIKAAMHFCGLPSGHCRLPLCEMLPENSSIVQNVVRQYVDTASPHFI